MRIKKTVTLVEISIYEKVIPLVSGYLQAYASQDHKIREHYTFIQYATDIETSIETMCESIFGHQSDLYAFSCYVWNIDKIQTIISRITETNPQAFIMLGGPQVMHHAKKYLDPRFENMVICNGEGEITFSNFLNACLDDQPDYSKIRGISFFKNGILTTTPDQERIKNLDEIPSPFTENIFKNRYLWGILETNRGCPYRCTFCFWGAANNDRVNRFSTERIKADINWLSQKGIPFLYIADANWGMFSRDIELSQFITECKEKNRVPINVQFSSAKNNPRNVLKFSEIFRKAGLFSTSSIALQSLDSKTLQTVDRKNVSLSAYKEIQQQLESKGIKTYTELIWPLPGETLDSFQKGIETLCEEKTHYIIVYSLVLLHNTPMYERQEELGLMTHEFEFVGQKNQIVVQTRDVTYHDFRAGCWFYFIVAALHNTLSYQTLRTYLHTNGLCSYATFFSHFAEYFKTRPTHPVTKTIEGLIDQGGMFAMDAIPTVYDLALNRERNAFDAALQQFLLLQVWWEDDNVRLLFELDRLLKPHIFSNTPLQLPQDTEFIKEVTLQNRVYTVTLLTHLFPAIASNLSLDLHTNGSSQFHISHNQGQLPDHNNHTAVKRAEMIFGALWKVMSDLPRLIPFDK